MSIFCSTTTDLLFPEGQENQEQRDREQQQADGEAAGDQEGQPDDENDERKPQRQYFFHEVNIANPTVFCNLYFLQNSVVW